MRVCIIGSGCSGIVSAKHAQDCGFDFDVLESRNDIGGTWSMPIDGNVDEYGFTVYSTIYPALRTNLARQAMGFYDYPVKTSNSFLTRDEVYNFLIEYVDNFNLRDKIKLKREVRNVKPISDKKFEVTSIDKPTRKQIVDEYDAVMVCSGITNEPIIPNIPGRELFKGKIMHTNMYRTPEIFKDKRLLVIGAGPSAVDIVVFAIGVAKSIVISHHSLTMTNFQNRSDITEKPDVTRIINEEEIEFADGTKDSFDLILLGTGYKRHFPFLSEECGVIIGKYRVEPLYKHCISVEHPNLCIIGILDYVCAFSVSEIQARFYMKYLDGSMKLPSKEDMLRDTEEQLERRDRTEPDLYPYHVHNMKYYQSEYLKDLAETANIANVPPYITGIFNDCVKGVFTNIFNFRKYEYQVLDDTNFTKVPLS